VPKRDDGRTALSYLTERFAHSTEPQWRRRIEAGRVLVDGASVAAEARLRSGQTVTWLRPPWQEPDAPLEFSILYRDRALLAVAKPAGLPTLPGGGFLDHTLLALVRRQDPQAVPLHRLGRWTSGIVLFARVPKARAPLSDAWRSGAVWKSYRALAGGQASRHVFSVDARIGTVPHPLLGTVHAACARGRPASSRITVLEQREEAFLADVEIATGRPHQIRIHLAAAGHPLVGDPLYAKGGRPAEGCTALPGDPGYHLHAAQLRLRHPVTQRTLDLESPPPAELRPKDRGDPTIL
jgi:23S rRNA pseudouridine1911/1915/1917 synthase